MRTWRIRGKIPQSYLKDLPEPEMVRRFLFYRGIKTKQEAEYFLNPDYERDLGDPLKILNMARAVRRILRAIKNNERVIVFADYDADGVCASVLFYDFFKKIGFDNFKVYIPNRHYEGYGLTLEAVEGFIKSGVDLIITVDCGVTDYEEIKKAKESGIDVVVIDHHMIPQKPPPAVAILDLHQQKEKYPFKYFSGAGLVFKTIEALIKKGDFNIDKSWSKWLLDTVALATIADMVPLLEENRVFVCYGLTVLSKTRRLGLRQLYRTLNLGTSNITEDDVAFLIAPRINIASRMGDVEVSFELLTTTSVSEAEWIIGRLEEKNAERKTIVGDILEEIDEKVSRLKELPEVITAGNDSWPPGVLGLACNRLLEKYFRSVFLWGKGENHKRKGSARGNGKVNLVELMRAVPAGIFLDFGGHPLAAGFTLEESVGGEDFEKSIERALEKTKKKKIEPEVLWLDAELSLDDVNWDLVSLLERLRPFGMDNPKPVFLFSNLQIFEVRAFGNEGIHLKLKFEKSNKEIISAIGFFMHNSFGRRPTGEAFEPKIERGSRIDLAASIEKSTFRGYNEIRLRIVDIKLRL